MRPIFLIGFMGCGKTTLGRALGALSMLRFIDLDAHIEAVTHRRIGQIFDEKGEEAFRMIESRMLDELSLQDDVVIACGGGTACFNGNMGLMNSRGTTVFMDTSMPRLLERLKAGRRKRPLLSALDNDELERFVIRRFAERKPFYDQAKAVFSGDLLETLDEVRMSAERFIESFGICKDVNRQLYD